MKFQLFLIHFCIFHTKSIFGDKHSFEILYPPQIQNMDGPQLTVVGGQDAKDGQVPFQCSLQKRFIKHMCGCAILSPRWIITAAHCLSGPAKNFQVLVGTNNLKGNGTYYSVEKYLNHENYNNPRYSNDIAVIYVNSSIVFNAKVQPIKFSDKEIDKGCAQLTGWGRLSSNGEIPDKLQVLNVSIISTSNCKESNANVQDCHLCTSNKEGEGACYGDSGGPLVYKNELIGLVNFGIPCALGYPDAYAKISYFYNWINDKTGLNEIVV